MFGYVNLFNLRQFFGSFQLTCTRKNDYMPTTNLVTDETFRIFTEIFFKLYFFLCSEPPSKVRLVRFLTLCMSVYTERLIDYFSAFKSDVAPAPENVFRIPFECYLFVLGLVILVMWKNNISTLKSHYLHHLQYYLTTFI